MPGISTDFNLRAGYGEGIAEFETVTDPVKGDRAPILGIKAPSVDDAFEEEHTTLKRRLEFQRKREAVAEEKRILYVAMTRARDHLGLVGTVGCDGDGIESVDTGDEEDPSNWHDLIGPVLFDDEVVANLAADGDAKVLQNATERATVRLPLGGFEPLHAAQPVRNE